MSSPVHTSDTSIMLEGDPFMNIQTIHHKSAAIDREVELVTLWRQAILGDAAALQAFLRRVMPANAVEVSPAIVVSDVSFDHRRPTRAAA